MIDPRAIARLGGAQQTAVSAELEAAMKQVQSDAWELAVAQFAKDVLGAGATGEVRKQAEAYVGRFLGKQNVRAGAE